MFNSRYSKKRSTIDDIVRSLVPYDGSRFETSDGDSEAYILPVEFISENLYAFFEIDGKAVETMIGFKRTSRSLETSYYHITRKGVRKAKPRDNVVYLPLLKTSLDIPAGNGKFLSVFGAAEPIPLVFAAETDEGVRCGALYDDDGSVKVYSYGIMSNVNARSICVVETGSRSKERQKVENRILARAAGKKGIDFNDAKSVVRFLDERVVGQDDAKMISAVAFKRYYAFMQGKISHDDLRKSNLFFIGPTGVGKSLIVSTLAKELSIPYTRVSLTGKSADGFKGDQLSQFFREFRSKAKGSEPYGVIFLDEIDKIAHVYDGMDDFGRQLQDHVLGWIEEGTVRIEDSTDSFSTKNILFVAAGAFHGLDGAGLEKIVQERSKLKSTFGFGAKDVPASAYLSNVTPDDLIKYGLKPELVGRFSYFAALNPLSVEEKIKVLTCVKNPVLEGYKKLLKAEGFDVSYSDDLPKYIAEKCPKETGARALTSVCDHMFTKILLSPAGFVQKKKHIHIDKELASKLITLY